MPWSVRFICCGKQFKFSVKGDLRVAFFMPQSNTVTLKITALDNATRVINDIKKSLNGLGNDRNNDKLKKTFEPVSRNLTQLREGIVAVSRAVVGFAVLGASTAGLFRFGKAAADTANQIIDISSKYQVGTQSLQVYASLIEGAGGKMEDVGKSMSKLQLAMSEAIRGSAEYQAAFQGIGLSVSELKSMTPEDVMLEMADAFSRSNNEMAKQEVLYKLLGKSGNLWMETLNNGTQEYLGRLKEMQDDGALISEEDMVRARDFNDTWDRVARLVRSIHVGFSLDFMKAFEPTLNRIRELISENRGEIQESLNELAVSLPPIFEAMAKFGAVFLKVFTAVSQLLAGLINQIGALPVGIIAFGVAFHKVLIPLINTIVSVGKLIFPIVRAFLNVPTLAITVLATAIMNMDKITAYISKAWERVKTIFKRNFIEGIFAALIEIITGLINGFIGLVKSVLPDFVQPDWLKNYNFSSPTEGLAKQYGIGQTQIPAIESASQRASVRQAVPQDQSTHNDVRGQITVKVQTDRGTKATVQSMQADKGLELAAQTGLLFGGN